MKQLATEFKDFVNEYKIITLAVALIMGQATNELVKSFVANIFMPFVTPLISAQNWEDAILYLGPVHIKWGLFVSALLNFVILALIIFLVVRKLMKREVKK